MAIRFMFCKAAGLMGCRSPWGGRKYAHVPARVASAVTASNTSLSMEGRQSVEVGVDVEPMGVMAIRVLDGLTGFGV